MQSQGIRGPPAPDLFCAGGRDGPAPSAIDPAVTRDPDNGDVWVSFGGGHIYTVR